MLNEDYKDMLQALADEKVEFLLVGAYALAAHGYPRATMDIDIWVMPSPESVRGSDSWPPSSRVSQSVYRTLVAIAYQSLSVSNGQPMMPPRRDTARMPNCPIRVAATALRLPPAQ